MTIAYEIDLMRLGDLQTALTLWHNQFDRYCKNDSFPDFWSGGEPTVEQYLLQQIEEGNALVAKEDETVVGYMAWMGFDFHNERTAFLPIVGSAATADSETAVCHALYTAASQKWVRDNRFNHLWMTFYDDTNLKELLYDMGFGSYVVDVC